MADITDPAVIHWLNEKLRPYCNSAVGMHLNGQVLVDEWRNQIKPLMSANAGTDEVLDGAHTNGRKIQMKGDMERAVDQIERNIAVQNGEEITPAFGAGAWDNIQHPHFRIVAPF